MGLPELFGKVWVERNKDTIEIKRHPLFGNFVRAIYDIRKGSLKISDYTLNKGGVCYFDDDYDGKVEVIAVNFDFYRRADDEQSFLKADKKLAEYKQLLNVDEIVERELRKPAPKLDDIL
ncbi:hypothetical protein HZA97_04825 [Candidatus Woesearchaeota archaeon]|nr:hypothetical protein [Candidatus Woesearchaeota archaeon]